MKKQKFSISLVVPLVSVAMILSACEANPFPKTGQVTTTKPDEKRKEAAPIGIDVPLVMTFSEGVETSYDVVGWVPAGDPILSIEGLPATATYDFTQGKLTWTPPFDAANDPKTPGTITRLYNVTFRLASSLAPNTITTRETKLLVNDSPRVDRVAVAGALQMNEGSEYVETIRVDSADFPAGPFTLQAAGLPATATVTKTSSNTFAVRFLPNNREASQYRERNYQVNYVVLGPNGVSVTVPERTWKVFDVDQPVRVYGATNVRQGMSMAVEWTLEDLNGESAPSLSISSVPVHGNLKVTSQGSIPTSPGGNPMSSFLISWTEIPDSLAGTEETLQVSICGRSCYSRPLVVHFEALVRQLPKIDRAAWQLNSMRYVRAGSRESVNLPILAMGPNDAIAKVEVTAAENEVTWQYGRLTVQPRTAGMKQFVVRATSRYGAVSVENFFYEALPVNWSNVLIMGDSLRDPEVIFAQKIYPDAAVINPSMQSLDARAMAMRDLLVIGTSALTSPAITEIERISAESRATILISSPALDLLQGGLKSEIAAGGLLLAGRPFEVNALQYFGRHARFADKTRLVPVAGSTLSSPRGDVNFKGTTSSLSISPMTFAFGLRATCEPALNALHNGSMFVVAATCQLRNHRIILAGFEWADLVFDSSVDADLAKQWLKELVN